MFTRTDLDTLMADASSDAISFYLPTHVQGAEVREGPIRLKNLVAQARTELTEHPHNGLDANAIEAILAPALTLAEDYQFWQHQDLGLAIFLGDGEPQRFNVPITLPEQVTVGHRFHVRPLLPLLAADGQFYVCTITEDQVRLSLGSRFGMTDLSLADLPDGAHDDLDDTSDYENPLQASPVARTHTGHSNIPNAQVYGSSPPEWRKGRVGVYVDRAAVVVDDAVRADPAPVVLIASPELAGHFAKASTLGALLVATVNTNPAATDHPHLHELAYAAVRPLLDGSRREAVARFATLHGRQDPRAITDDASISAMSGDGRVESLLLVEESPNGDDPLPDINHSLVEAAVARTLKHGGTVHMVPASDLPGVVVAATLRY